MLLYSIILFLIFIKYHLFKLLNGFPRWYNKSKPEKILQYKSIKDYLKIGNCQSIFNDCKEIPSYPLKRAYHISITYKTYSLEEANELCPLNYCGPFCNYTSDNCRSNQAYLNLPNVTNFELNNFKSPSSSSCPEDCCSSDNEFCYRLINNAGNEIFPGQEIMLIFGGLTLNKVKFKQDDIEKNIFLNCEEIIAGLNISLLTNKKKKNLLYLINNCGYEMSNELWEYNIRNDSWKYLKPYVDKNIMNQQKPYPRYGHAGVYVEIMDTEINFLRKYLFIYGGFSLYCQHSCEDMWKYEISYGPQRFYPKYNNNSWERGNKWKRIDLINTLNPGKRALHSMIVDSEFNFIYLFGGYSFDKNSNYITLMDDLWRYDIKENSWEKLNTEGIYLIQRLITYWDGSSKIINISPKNYNQETDTINTTTKENNLNNSIIGSFPTKRSSASLSYNKRNDSSFILLFGGLSYNTSNSYNIHYILNDIWIYNITNNLWLEIHSNDEKPNARYGHQMISLEEDIFILYGGISSNIINNDLWLFKFGQNIWKEINKEETTTFSELSNLEKWPYPSGFFSMVNFSEGIIIYGGLIWKQKNQNFQFYKNYSDEEETLFQSSLFNTLENLYILYFNQCKNNCNEKGVCHFGICICNELFWGNDCKNNSCQKGLCFFEDDFHIKQECIYCSGNGECLENGKCLCDEGYIGDDCSIAECLNNCSGEPFGKCVIKKPVSQCECNLELKRGGDDCSKIFCLNNCGTEGICNRNIGECECPNNYYGIDCSVYVVGFREKSNFINKNIIIIIFFIILYL